MLTILGPESERQGRFCDGLSRRSFLRVGGLVGGLGGLSLPRILAAEAAQGTGSSSQKAVILIYLPGGPPHQDLFDLKMDAPSEIRGELRPIETNVSGIQICELLPRLAKIMDKLVVVRSVVGSEGQHNAFQSMTGRTQARQPPGGWPELGSIVSRVRGVTRPGMPPFVNLAPIMQHKPYNAGRPGFLGVADSPFRPDGEGKSDLVLHENVSLTRFRGRGELLTGFDRFRRAADADGAMRGMDAFQRQALDVLTSSRLAEALDLEREDKALRDRYGYGTEKHQGDGAPRLMQHFLLARRLIEAGVRCVTVSFSFWDWHSANFGRARENMPDLDQGVSALVEDLHQRGLDKDVTVLVLGEFGRTPKINKDAGRDHWPKVSCAMLAGGGMRTGQAIGTTNRLGEEAKDRPVHFQELYATVYHNLGLDPATTTVPDYSGRPHYLVDSGYAPLPEVI